jgi:uncharacterized repeat protein (TIGR03803 family)
MRVQLFRPFACIGLSFLALALPAAASREKALYAFRDGADGVDPNGPLVADATGALYGTTYMGGNGGGNCGCGTVFKLTPSGSGYVESVLYSFKLDGNDGHYPVAGLAIDSSGALYGTTSSGGFATRQCSDSGCGTVFKLTPSQV